MDIRILFVFVPLYVKYNYGIALLSSLCKVFGVKTEVYLLDNIDKFSDYLDNKHFNYVCFSCVTKYDYELSLPFMQIASTKGTITLLGGVFPRLGTYLQAPVDLICRGEAEMLPLFLTKDYTKLFESPQYYDDLNELPLPDYELFKDIPYNRELPFGSWDKILPYSSSRGCLFRCYFCAVSYQPLGVRIRTKVGKDLGRIIGEYSPDIIHFMDELIPYYDEAWRESWGDLNFPFAAYIRADISEKQLIWLKDHGLVGCFFGVESGNETYRNDVLGKKLSDRQIKRTVCQLKEMEIPFMASYMTEMPGETWPMKAETVRLSREIGGNPIFYRYENLGEG